MYIHVLLLHVSCFVCVNFKCYFVLLGVKLTFKRICVFLIQTAHFYGFPSRRYNHFHRVDYYRLTWNSNFATGPLISRLCLYGISYYTKIRRKTIAFAETNSTITSKGSGKKVQVSHIFVLSEDCSIRWCHC